MLMVTAVILQLFEIGSWNFCVAAQYFQLERPLTLGFELSMLDSTPTSQLGFLTTPELDCQSSSSNRNFTTWQCK